MWIYGTVAHEEGVMKGGRLGITNNDGDDEKLVPA